MDEKHPIPAVAAPPRTSLRRALAATFWFVLFWVGLNFVVSLVLCLGFGPWGAALEGIDPHQLPVWYGYTGIALQIVLVAAAILLTRRIICHHERRRAPS